jgi:hypothetical protein
VLRRQGPSLRPGVYYFNSFFAEKLGEKGTYDYDKVMRWTLVHPKLPKDDLANWRLNGVDTILIPVNSSKTHWFLAGIYVKEKKIICYDSLEVSPCLLPLCSWPLHGLVPMAYCAPPDPMHGLVPMCSGAPDPMHGLARSHVLWCPPLTPCMASFPCALVSPALPRSKVTASN